MISQVVRPLRRNVLQPGLSKVKLFARQAHDVVKEEGKALMDLMPVPEGPWEEGFKKKNARANLTLAIGVASFAFTYFVILCGGKLTMNVVYPAVPEDRRI